MDRAQTNLRQSKPESVPLVCDPIPRRFEAVDEKVEHVGADRGDPAGQTGEEPDDVVDPVTNPIHRARKRILQMIEHADHDIDRAFYEPGDPTENGVDDVPEGFA